MTRSHYSIPHAAREVGISKQQMYKYVDKGLIKTVANGKQKEITAAELKKFLVRYKKRKKALENAKW